jgi:hypothetical protein
VQLVEYGSIEAQVLQEGRCVGARGVQKHPSDLFADAFAADAAEVGGVSGDGLRGCGVEGEAEAGGEADGTEGTEVVLGEALVGVADGTYDTGVKVRQAANVVVDSPGGRASRTPERGGGGIGCGEGIQEERVDGEIAAAGV